MWSDLPNIYRLFFCEIELNDKLSARKHAPGAVKSFKTHDPRGSQKKIKEGTNTHTERDREKKRQTPGSRPRKSAYKKDQNLLCHVKGRQAGWQKGASRGGAGTGTGWYKDWCG